MAKVRGSLFGRQEVEPLSPGSVGLHTPDFVIPQLNNTVAQPSTPLRGNLQSFAAPVLGGLQAAQGTPVGTDLSSSLISGGVSTLTGAGSGALAGAAIGAAGGPIGAVGGALIGGGTALLSSMVNSFLGTKKENKRKREMKRLIKEIEAKRAREKAQNRSDQFLQLKMNRKDSERNQAISAFSTKRQLLFNAINNNPLLKQRFIKTGVR